MAKIATVQTVPSVLPVFSPLATGVSIAALPDGAVLLRVERQSTGVPSKTGKTVLKANTHGFMSVPGYDGESINLLWTGTK